MIQGSKASQALAVVAEIPSTTGEVAAVLGWTSHMACVHLQNLHRKGKIRRARFPTGRKDVRYLWSLAE